MPNYYSAGVSRPVAVAALHGRNAITTALNSNPALGGGFVATPIGTIGYKWRNNRYTISLAIPEEDENAVDWQHIPEGYVPEEYATLEFELTIYPEQNPAAGEFTAARDAIKTIIATPSPAGAGRKRRNRKSRKGGKKHRTTRRK